MIWIKLYLKLKSTISTSLQTKVQVNSMRKQECFMEVVVVSMLFVNTYCITLYSYTDIVNRHDIHNYINMIFFSLFRRWMHIQEETSKQQTCTVAVGRQTDCSKRYFKKMKQ